MRNVAILTYSGLSMFELGCAVELFALPRPEFNTWYNTDIVTFENKPLTSTANIKLETKYITDLSGYDMLVIPSWPVEFTATNYSTINNSIKNNSNSMQISSQMQKLIARGGRIISFCSGAFLLAYSGLLNNKKATTHWRYAEKFQQNFPFIQYVDNVLYLYDGTLGCSAGSAAAIDLGLAVIRDDFGHSIANQVARRLVVASHRSGGQAQFVETPMPKKHDLFSSTLDWAIKNLTTPLSIDKLADKANMSRRTFDRKFSATFNISAKAWLIEQKVARAKQLLEESRYSIEQIAHFSGFDNAMTLRHHFRKQLGITPSQYRLQFSTNNFQAIQN